MERLPAHLYDAEIAKGGWLFLVFSMGSCAPCERMKAAIAEVEGDYPGVRFRYVSAKTLQSAQLERQLGVDGVPRSFLIHDGVVVGTFLGARAAATLRMYLDGLVGAR